jgi:hypothetical protein
MKGKDNRGGGGKSNSSFFLLQKSACFHGFDVLKRSEILSFIFTSIKLKDIIGVVGASGHDDGGGKSNSVKIRIFCYSQCCLFPWF